MRTVSNLYVIISSVVYSYISFRLSKKILAVKCTMSYECDHGGMFPKLPPFPYLDTNTNKKAEQQ